MSTKRLVSVFLPYRKEEGEIRIFLQKRTIDAKNFPDVFGFFGGGVDEGETPEEALEREVWEELNIRVRDYEFLRTYDTMEKFNQPSILHVFTKEVSDDFENEIKVQEGQYGKFLTKEKIAQEKMIEWDRFIALELIDFLERNKSSQ